MPTKTKTETKTKPRRRTPAERGTPGKLRKLAAELRRFATSFDGATEDYPWGERVVKGPNGKVFVFLGDPYLLDGKLCFTVKLNRSRREVLRLPFAKPCGYGLGKHGWVTLKVAPVDAPPVKVMRGWIAESHGAVVGGGGDGDGARPRRA